MVVVLVIMMMTLMSRRRGYLKTVTFESVYKPPTCYCTAVFLYSFTQFRLPHNILKVLYRNLPACHFFGKEEQ